jgi:acyl-CoA synthetase (AMP-forming)/AMP-acid ligase II
VAGDVIESQLEEVMPNQATASTPAAPKAPLPPLAADTVPVMWRAMVEAYADRVMLRWNGVSHTYREIDQRSAAMARGLLAEGAGKGARIGVLAPNGADWVVAWLAANRIGALAIGLSTLFSAPELAYGVSHADISVLLCADRYLRHDYVGRLEQAFPELAGLDGAEPLALAAAPFLRSVRFTAKTDRAWSRGSFAELEALGAASSVFSAEILAAAEAQVAPSDLGLMMYTSGSTAHPKGVVHTQGAMVRKAVFLGSDRGIIPFDLRPDDRLIVPAPFFWVGGFLTLTGAMLYGARVICVDDHSPDALLEAVRSEEATHLGAAEAKLLAIQDSPAYHPGDFDRLRMENAFQFAFFQRDPQLRSRIPNSLGMTETMGPHSGDITGAMLPPEAAGSVCKVLAGMEYRIVDPDTGEAPPPGQSGELCVRGVFLMDGMYRKERAAVFDADGFYHTGDRCLLRDDGYLFFESRISGMIKTSGANVSPEEVELAILATGEAAEAAVMGLPDERAGQIVIAAVIPRADSTVSEHELQARLRAQLSSFKVPRRIFFFAYDAVPRTPSNKIRKPPLAEQIAEMLASEADA